MGNVAGKKLPTVEQVEIIITEYGTTGIDTLAERFGLEPAVRVRISPGVGRSLFLPFGEFHDPERVLVECLQGIDQCLEGHRFDDVAVHPEVVATADVLIVFGRGQHHNWDGLKIGILLELLKRRPSILSWHVQIEQDEPGTRSLCR